MSLNLKSQKFGRSTTHFDEQSRFCLGLATLAIRFFRSTRNLKFLSTFFVAYSKLSLRQPCLSRRGAHSIFLLRSVNRIFEISFKLFSVTARRFSASCSSTLLGGARKLAGTPFPSRTFSKKVTRMTKIEDAMPCAAIPRIAIGPREYQASRAIGFFNHRTDFARGIFLEIGFAGTIGAGCAARYRFTNSPTARAETSATRSVISWRVSFMRESGS